MRHHLRKDGVVGSATYECQGEACELLAAFRYSNKTVATADTYDKQQWFYTQLASVILSDKTPKI